MRERDIERWCVCETERGTYRVCVGEREREREREREITYILRVHIIMDNTLSEIFDSLSIFLFK